MAVPDIYWTFACRQSDFFHSFSPACSRSPAVVLCHLSAFQCHVVQKCEPGCLNRCFADANQPAPARGLSSAFAMWAAVPASIFDFRAFHSVGSIKFLACWWMTSDAFSKEQVDSYSLLALLRFCFACSFWCKLVFACRRTLSLTRHICQFWSSRSPCASTYIFCWFDFQTNFLNCWVICCYVGIVMSLLFLDRDFRSRFSWFLDFLTAPIFRSRFLIQTEKLQIICLLLHVWLVVSGFHLWCFWLIWLIWCDCLSPLSRIIFLRLTLCLLFHYFLAVRWI